MTTIQEKKHDGERYMLPPPQWVVRDADGATAVVSSWHHRGAWHAGYTLLAQHYGKAPAQPMSVTEKEDDGTFGT